MKMLACRLRIVRAIKDEERACEDDNEDNGIAHGVRSSGSRGLAEETNAGIRQELGGDRQSAIRPAADTTPPATVLAAPDMPRSPADGPDVLRSPAPGVCRSTTKKYPAMSAAAIRRSFGTGSALGKSDAKNLSGKSGAGRARDGTRYRAIWQVTAKCV